MGRFLYEPASPTLADVLQGKAEVSNKKLIEIIKVLVDKMDGDPGITAVDHATTLESLINE
jgi:hypothetical protein